MGLSPTGGAQALRQRDRVRRARGVQGPQAQELLLGHARPARVLGGDPGRRRHPADRRGARGRRRRVPAEVLRRVPHDCATAGKTIVFVTHDMGALQRFCHRALLLERGSTGPPRATRTRWRTDTSSSTSAASLEPVATPTAGHGRRRGAGARGLARGRGRASASRAVPQGQRITLKARVLFMVDVEDPAASVYIYNEEQKAVVVATTVDRQRPHAVDFDAGEEVVFSFTFDNVLAPGRYSPVFQLGASRLGLERDRPLRGRLLVRGHRPPARWAGSSTFRSDVDDRARRSSPSRSEVTTRERRRSPCPTRRSGGRSRDPRRSPATGGASGT